MQEQRNYGRRDQAPLAPSGDLAFVGIDMRAPALVPPGYASSATNKRIVDGVYETRRGLFSPVWGRHASEDFPYRADFLRDDDSEWRDNYATTYGTGPYADPDGEVWLVRATATALLFFRETEIGRIVPLAPNVEISGPVQIVQNFDELIITRGDDLTALRWDGNWSSQVAENVPDTIPSNYLAAPNARYAFAWRGRTCYLSGRDTFSLSREADNTLVHEDDEYFVNRGRGDEMRAGVPLGGFSVLLLKSQSLHVFTAAAADLADARIDPQPIDLQFDAPLTAIAADGRAWWLDRRGVRTARIAQIDADNKILLQVDVVSDKISPLIRRIAWKYASTFSAAVTTDRIYFAVALDTQTTPQSLLVWNRQNSEWESCDAWDTDTLGDFNVLGFATAIPWLNEPRLFGVSSTGQIAALEFGLGEDHVGWDDAAAVRADIADELITRGYTAGTSDPKKIVRAQVQIDTWHPTLELEAIFDGPGESLALAPIERDRTKYFTDEPDFAPNNADGRFHDPKRQDYSVVLPGPVPESGHTTWGDAQVVVIGDNRFRDANGHNYRALSAHTTATSNAPDQATGIWRYIRPDDGLGGAAYENTIIDDGATELADSDGFTLITSHAAPWVVGTAYVAGNYVGYNGGLYGCLLPNTATLGNPPETHPELWMDLGLDASMVLSALFLGDGVRLEDFQTKPERRDIGRDASWCQIAIRGTRGANKVRSVLLECQPGPFGNVLAA